MCGCWTSHQMSPSALSNVDIPFPLSDRNSHSIRRPNFMALLETPSCFESRVLPGKHWLTLSSWVLHEKKIKIITCTAVSQMPYALSQSTACYRTFASPAGAMPPKLAKRALWANFVQFSAVLAPIREVQAVIYLFLPHKEPM